MDGVTREASAELLWALDEDKMSVACIILDAIAASPIDCRQVEEISQVQESTVVFACGVQVCIGGVLGVGWGNSNDEGIPSSTQPRAEEPVGHPQV